MSETRLQDEYNKAVRTCDLFVCLFFSKAGKFTEEEFRVALDSFKEKGRPRIFTYFKDASVKMSSVTEEDLQSLRAFQKKLGELGHFWTKYESAEELQLHFRERLDKLIR